MVAHWANYGGLKVLHLSDRAHYEAFAAISQPPLIPSGSHAVVFVFNRT
jgi:hypothetical protein